MRWHPFKTNEFDLEEGRYSSKNSLLSVSKSSELHESITLLRIQREESSLEVTRNLNWIGGVFAGVVLGQFSTNLFQRIGEHSELLISSGACKNHSSSFACNWFWRLHPTRIMTRKGRKCPECVAWCSCNLIQLVAAVSQDTCLIVTQIRINRRMF